MSLRCCVGAAVAACVVVFAARAANAHPPAGCAKGAIGLERVIEVDTTGAPRFGSLQFPDRGNPLGLRPKEVVLTFDDGPHESNTRSILDTLDRHCTRATFFAVGAAALEHPDVLREISRRGHTIGGHSLTHPANLRRLSAKRAEAEIMRGFRALDTALKGNGTAAILAGAARLPVPDALVSPAPFFRFPGLNRSAKVDDVLRDNDIAVFSVDVVSDDTRPIGTRRMIARTLHRLARTRGGIVLMHDIKSKTARALPRLLAALKRRGYKIVHLVPKRSWAVLEAVRRATRARRDLARKTLEIEMNFRMFERAAGTIPGRTSSNGTEIEE